MVKKKSLDIDFDLSSASINAPQDMVDNTNKVNTDGKETIKRLTIDIPSSLHKKLKMMAMEQEITMANMIRTWLESKV